MLVIGESPVVRAGLEAALESDRFESGRDVRFGRFGRNA